MMAVASLKMAESWIILYSGCEISTCNALYRAFQDVRCLLAINVRM